jgi:hypothetical protein
LAFGSHSERSGFDAGSFVQRSFCASCRCGCAIFDSVFNSILHSIIEPEKHYYKKEEQQNRGRAQKAQAGVSTDAAHA